MPKPKDEPPVTAETQEMVEMEKMLRSKDAERAAREKAPKKSSSSRFFAGNADDRPRTRRALGQCRSQVGGQFALQGATALDEERLVDRFVADAHPLVIREVDGQEPGDLFRAPGPRPSRSSRGPRRPPCQDTAGLGTRLPQLVRTTPPSFSTT